MNYDTINNIVNIGNGFGTIVKNFIRRDDFCLEITMTDACNMRCEYCFEHKNKLSSRISIDDIIRSVYGILESEDFLKNYKNLHLTMWGGEPTLEAKNIIHLIREFGQNPAVTWYVYTNGTLSNKLFQIVDKLIQYDAAKRASFQFSWDGDPIHAIRRSDNSSLVKDNFLTVHQSGIHSTFKSCILPEDFHLMPKAWISYRDFMESNFDDDCPDIAYTPTIDQMFRGASDNYLKDFEQAIVEICSYEIDFVKRYKRHLLSWFGGDMKVCSYRKNMCCIGTDGSVYSCHGVPYSDERTKTDETIGNISDPLWFHKYSVGKKYDIVYPQKCVTCKATYCAKCSVQCAMLSKKEDRMERWFDREIQDGICRFYELFGAYDKALHTILMRNNND